jgi:capsular exopolysaccharide synthesis family protein
MMGPPFTRELVADSVTVSELGDTKLAGISATWTSPEVAARLANAYATDIVVTRQHSDAAYYARALRSVQLQLRALTPAQQDGPQTAALKTREASLETLTQLQSADVQVQQGAAVPAEPSSPKVTRNTVLGGVLGLLLGAGCAFLLHRFDRRLREPSELEEIFGVPLIGVIPESQALKAPRTSDDGRKPLPHREAEVFGLLRAHVRYFNVDRELRLIVVVSAAPGEGKTTVARNLAVTSAMAGSRVLLVEADLRRPTISRQLSVKPLPGLAEVLLGGTRLDTGIQHVQFDSQNGGSVGVDVLVAGGLLPPNPTHVIESSSMKALLDEARQSYDLVIVDTPPLVLVPDAFPLLAQSDAVIVVSRLGRNRRDIATRLRAALRSADAPVVGVVANGVGRTHGQSYGYDSGYSAQASDIPQGPPAPSPAQSNGHAAVLDPPSIVVEQVSPVPSPLSANGHDVAEKAAVAVAEVSAVPSPPAANGFRADWPSNGNGSSPRTDTIRRGSIAPPQATAVDEGAARTNRDLGGLRLKLGRRARRFRGSGASWQ